MRRTLGNLIGFAIRAGVVFTGLSLSIWLSGEWPPSYDLALFVVLFFALLWFLDDLDHKIEDLEEKIDSPYGGLKDLKSKMDDLEEKMDEIQRDLKRNEESGRTKEKAKKKIEK